MNPLVLIAAFPIELLALFAIWNWRIRARSAGWLIAGCITSIGLATLPILLPAPLVGRVYLGLAGMYFFSALAWAWWAEGLRPAEWRHGEVLIALVATGLFALANG